MDKYYYISYEAFNAQGKSIKGSVVIATFAEFAPLDCVVKEVMATDSKINEVVLLLCQEINRACFDGFDTIPTIPKIRRFK